MESIKMKNFIIFFTFLSVLIAHSTALKNDEFSAHKNLNFTNSQDDPKYWILHHGMRVANDEIIKWGQKILPATKEQNRLNISARHGAYKWVISFIKFNYTSMNEKLPNCSLEVTAGGAGFDWVEIEFSCEYRSIYLQYEIYGIENSFSEFASAVNREERSRLRRPGCNVDGTPAYQQVKNDKKTDSRPAGTSLIEKTIHKLIIKHKNV